MYSTPPASSNLLAFGALCQFSLFKPVFRGDLAIFPDKWYNKLKVICSRTCTDRQVSFHIIKATPHKKPFIGFCTCLACIFLVWRKKSHDYSTDMLHVAPNLHLAQFVLARRQPCVVLIVQSDEKSSFANKRSVILAKLTAQYTHNLCAVLP